MDPRMREDDRMASLHLLGLDTEELTIKFEVHVLPRQNNCGCRNDANQSQALSAISAQFQPLLRTQGIQFSFAQLPNNWNWTLWNFLLICCLQGQHPNRR
jgi:hypothetical protein